jgi:hypothetical protein
VPLKIEGRVNDFFFKFFSPHQDPESHRLDKGEEANFRRTRFYHSLIQELKVTLSSHNIHTMNLFKYDRLGISP